MDLSTSGKTLAVGAKHHPPGKKSVYVDIQLFDEDPCKQVGNWLANLAKQVKDIWREVKIKSKMCYSGHSQVYFNRKHFRICF